jgi:glyoxylase-like metal-dependent hydrolase (beta-lactamase superfamily II)
VSAPGIHHFNCGTLRPRPARLVGFAGGSLRRGRLVTHVLLVETAAGLTLVDSGLGLADVAAPSRRLGRVFLAMAAPALDPGETAVRRIEELGHAARDVRHVVLTHLDLDHAGGLSDFPAAEVHVLAAEHEAATRPRSWRERSRYREIQWAHEPRWRLHRAEAGERWLGFEQVRALTTPEVLLVPLAGHSRGHAAVAVHTPTGWLLHAGDAYFHHDELRAEGPRCPAALRWLQRLESTDEGARRHNQARLRELRVHGHAEVTVVCAHDPSELDGCIRARR